MIFSSGYGFSCRAALDDGHQCHSGFVPRVGGLAIYISLLGLIPLLTFGFIPLSVVFELNATNLSLIIALPCLLWVSRRSWIRNVTKSAADCISDFKYSRNHIIQSLAFKSWSSMLIPCCFLRRLQFCLRFFYSVL